MQIGQIIQFAPTPTYAKSNHCEHIQKGKVLTMSTGYCFVEIENTKKIEIIDKNCIIQ